MDLTIHPSKPGLFNGVYSYKEAGHLVGVPSSRIRRWADGYFYRLRYGRGESKPVLQTNRAKSRGVLSFDELLELFFVRQYTSFEVSLQHVRATAEKLAETLGPYPFSAARLLRNGRELIQGAAETVLERPDVGQIVAAFAEELSDRVECEHGYAQEYRPKSLHDRVYLNRGIRSGEAVVTEYAVPTRAIYMLWKRERAFEPVVEYFNIEQLAVESAVQYEGQWSRAA